MLTLNTPSKVNVSVSLQKPHHIIYTFSFFTLDYVAHPPWNLPVTMETKGY